jgi:hypothetical protein
MRVHPRRLVERVLDAWSLPVAPGILRPTTEERQYGHKHR